MATGVAATPGAGAAGEGEARGKHRNENDTSMDTRTRAVAAEPAAAAASLAALGRSPHASYRRARRLHAAKDVVQALAVAVRGPGSQDDALPAGSARERRNARRGETDRDPPAAQPAGIEAGPRVHGMVKRLVVVGNGVHDFCFQSREAPPRP